MTVAASKPLFKKIVIVGVGLLGGSIAAAAKKHHLIESCVGIDSSTEHLDTAKQMGLIDAIGAFDTNTLGDADLLILCTPVATLPKLFAQALPLLPSTAIISDVGSTKASLVDAVTPLLKPEHAVFIPAHPIAGSQYSGPQASQANLFEEKPLLLTPLPNTPQWALEKLREFWHCLGSEIIEGSPEWHDEVFAEVSHAPHLLAFLAVDLIDKRPNSEQLWALAGTGLRDFTRIGGSHPEMWRDISLHNREALLASLRRYQTGLNQLIETLDKNDGETLYTLFQRARHARLKRWSQ